MKSIQSSVWALPFFALLVPALAGAGTVRLDGDDFQSIVDHNPPGTTFIVASGKHRLQQVVPKDGDVFIGELDRKGRRLSTLSGAKLFKDRDWARTADGFWVAPLGVRGFQRGIRHGQCTVPEGTIPQGESGVEYSIKHNLPCIFPEVLFRDDSFLKRVSWISDLGSDPNTWYFDYDNEKVYVASDPMGHKIEISLTPFAFGYEVAPDKKGGYRPKRRPAAHPLNCNPFELDQEHPPRSAFRLYPPTLCGDLLPNPHFPNDYDTYKPAQVVIKNLIVEKYANPPQTGAIGYFRPGLDWKIINNEVRYNHGSGIKFKGTALVEGNYAHDNGDFGIETGDGNTKPVEGGHLVADGDAPFNGLSEWGYWGGYSGRNAVVKDNTISHNNVVLAFYNNMDMRIEPGWGAGGAKFSQAENLLVQDNVVDANNGSGLWADFSYDGTIYVGNIIRENTGLVGGALFHEVSGSAEMLCNSVKNNRFPQLNDATRYAQIFISNSRHVKISFNDVTAPTDIAVDGVTKYGGNAITVDDAGNRTNEELPALAFQDAIRANNITLLNDYGVVGVSGSTDDIITSPAAVLMHLGTVTFDYDVYHVSDLDEKHWQWVNEDLTKELLTFGEFRKYIGQETHGSVDQNLEAKLPLFIVRHCESRLGD